jgi:hypothetical protein
MEHPLGWMNEASFKIALLKEVYGTAGRAAGK